MTMFEDLLQAQKEFFWKGHSRDIDFRLDALTRLRDGIKSRENEVLDALYHDLHKAAVDAFSTEVGIVYDEISYALKNIRSWAKPEKVKSPFFMWPSRSYVQKEPYGSSLIIAPWNYPFALLMVPLVGAIGAGNTAILKPSEISAHTAAIAEKIINNIFPREYICAVQGAVAETQALLELPVDYIFFTGSVAVGKAVMAAAARNLTPLTLELGGKSPAIVHKDAVLADAARKIAWGKFINAGQTCIAPDYVLVHNDIKDNFIAELKKVIVDFYGEDASAHSRYCRIISDRHFARLAALPDKNKIIYGGRMDSAVRYIEPTLLYPSCWNDEIMHDEIFGPLLPIITYTTLDDIIRKINERPKPLALYLFSDDSAVQKLITAKISYGGGAVNNTILHVASHFLPFGGVGPSGIGCYHGKASFDTFTHFKSIVKSSSRFDLGFAYPNNKRISLKLLRKIMK